MIGFLFPQRVTAKIRTPGDDQVCFILPVFSIFPSATFFLFSSVLSILLNLRSNPIISPFFLYHICIVKVKWNKVSFTLNREQEADQFLYQSLSSCAGWSPVATETEMLLHLRG